MMTSKDVLHAFHDEVPVRFGNLVFNRIESVNYKRTQYNEYIESNTLDGVSTRLIKPKMLKIVQAVCSDLAGNMYVLNPLRLEEATQDEVNVVNDGDHLLNERLKLIPIFEAWCEEHGIAVTIDALLVFLFAEDLINAGKAYHAVEAYEQAKIREEEEI